MNGKARPAAFAAILALGALLSASIVQAHPLPQAVLSRGAVNVARPVPVGRSLHNVFGTIVKIVSPKFLLRTRYGRLLTVDATTALQRGTYSAPLFVGKVVVVGGMFDAASVFHATTVTRQTRLDRMTPADT
jgi:hypothetical protein